MVLGAPTLVVNSPFPALTAGHFGHLCDSKRLIRDLLVLFELWDNGSDVGSWIFPFCSHLLTLLGISPPSSGFGSCLHLKISFLLVSS